MKNIINGRYLILQQLNDGQGNLRLSITDEGRDFLRDNVVIKTEKRSNMFGSLPDVSIYNFTKSHECLLSDLLEDIRCNSEVELLENGFVDFIKAEESEDK